MKWPILAVLLLLAAPALADTTVVSLQASDDPAVLASGASTISITTQLTVSADRNAYLKVLPLPSNPVFDNGTIDGAGWWTEVFIGSATTRIGATIGSGMVELGPITANTPVPLRLVVHVPSAAQNANKIVSLAYAVAVHAQSSGSGSGGELDPSSSWLPRIQLGTPPVVAASGGGAQDATTPANPDATTGSSDQGAPGGSGGGSNPGTSVSADHLQASNTGVDAMPEDVQVGRMVLPFIPTLTLVLLMIALTVALFMVMAMNRRRAKRRNAEAVLAMDQLLAALPEDRIMAFISSGKSEGYLRMVAEAKRLRHE